MKINNQNGSLIIQALLGIGIFSIVTVSVIRLMQMQNNLSLKTTEEFEIVYFVSELRNILSNPLACQATFEGKIPRNDRTIRAINQYLTDENDNAYTFPIFEKGMVFKETDQYSLKIADLYLLQHNDEVRVDAGTTGLHIEIEFTNKVNKRVRILERDIKLFITKSSNEKISNCYTMRGIGLGKEITSKSSDWIRKSDQSGFFIGNKKLLIATQRDVADINIGGAIHLSDVDLSCNDLNRNALKYSKEDNGLMVCSRKTNKWEKIGFNQPLVQKKILKISSPQKSKKTLTPFKICTLSFISNRTGMCELKRLPDSLWEISINSPGDNPLACEAFCKE